MDKPKQQIPILSILIPTYNRCHFLKECLNSVVKEVNSIEFSDDIEIIVSDNASTDNTKEMLKQDYPFVKYHCNAKNEGVEYNVDKCFEYANGIYTYILSDDDIMLPGSLKEIFKAIEYNPNFIHLNTVNFYKEFRGASQCTKPRLNLTQNLITEDKTAFFEVVNIHITFLSSSVYKTSIAKSVDRNLYKGELISSGQTVLQCLKEPGKYIVIQYPCVACRGGNTGGYNLFTVWVKGYKHLILEIGYETGIEQTTLKQVYKKTMRKYVFNFILTFRTTETGLSLQNRQYIFGGVKEFPSLWFPLIFVTYAPSKLLRYILTVYQRNIRK